MPVLLFEPHHDDATLFASFTCLTHRPLVVTVLGDAQVQRAVGITGEQRTAENKAAMAVLGCEWQEWPMPDVAPPWQLVEDNMRLLAASDFNPVFAPKVEQNGHEQHNHIGMLAIRVFGDRVTEYCTYTNGRERSRGRDVPFEPWMVSAKLRALACYESQHAEPSCAHHFIDHGLREWLA